MNAVAQCCTLAPWAAVGDLRFLAHADAYPTAGRQRYRRGVPVCKPKCILIGLTETEFTRQ